MIELSAGAARASVDPRRGGRLSSLRVAGVELLGGAPVPTGAPEAWFDGCFAMAPFAGRVRSGRFEFLGEQFELPVGADGHAAHGYVADAEWEITERETAAVELRVAIPEPWPFGGWVSQRIELDADGVRLALGCGNDEREMPVSLGYHPWFASEAFGAVAELRFAPERAFPVEAPGLFGLGTEAPGPVASGALAAGARDHSYEHAGDPEIAWGSRLLRLSSSSRVWHVFDGLPEGFCVEPVTAAPDGLRADRAITVEPGRPAELVFGMRWAGIPLY